MNKTNNAESSNGRIDGFEPSYLGPNPSSAAFMSNLLESGVTVAQLAVNEKVAGSNPASPAAE